MKNRYWTCSFHLSKIHVSNNAKFSKKEFGYWFRYIVLKTKIFYLCLKRINWSLKFQAAFLFSYSSSINCCIYTSNYWINDVITLISTNPLKPFIFLGFLPIGTLKINLYRPILYESILPSFIISQRSTITRLSWTRAHPFFRLNRWNYLNWITKGELLTFIGFRYLKFGGKSWSF